MSSELNTESSLLLASARFRSAKAELIASVLEASGRVRQIKPAPKDSSARESYLKAIQEFNRDRGRDLYYPFLSSGLGAGPFVELMDGSVKYDMITGIGINFFGHAHPALMGELVDAVSADIMQGNLEPGHEARALLRALLSRVGAGSKLNHGWLICSGTMANEIALKTIRQKRAPATRILAFNDCFHGRSTAMQELTDNPGYRQGQPLYGEVHYLPFYDARLGAASIENTLRVMREHLHRYAGKFAALLMEPVLGEGGFAFGPREFYVAVFEEAKKAGLAIWLDEVQTFGRTGELFAYQKLGLAEYPDVVTVGKMLQACAVLYSDEYNPKPGLVAGTFSGSTVALRTARKTLELLSEQGFLGKGGRIERLSGRFELKLKALPAGLIGELRVMGGMIAFSPLDGKMESVKAVLTRLFDLGVVAFYCGHGPYLIRLLPPLGAMEESDVDQVCSLIETALAETSSERKAKA